VLEKPFSAYEGDEPYIFVCYAHEDAALVYPELQRLHDDGINIWYDEGISPGQEWTQELADAIEDAAQLLYFVSPASVASRNCRDEIQYAKDHEKPLIAVHLKSSELPGGLKLSLGLDQAILKYEMREDVYQHKLASVLSPTSSESTTEREPTSPARSKTGAYGWSVLVIGLAAVVAGIWLSQQGNLTEPMDHSAPTSITIAILPFTNMSDDPEQEYFSDGITEDILNQLAKSTAMTVRPRSSSFRFKGSKEDPQSIGAQLKVTHLVEGSVRKAGQRVRITTNLINVANNSTLWSERYDQELSDIFQVQDEIAGEIFSALSVRLGGELPAELAGHATRSLENQEAYDAYLRGRFFAERFNNDEAESWFATATELNPDYADAWAMRAHTNTNQSTLGTVPNAGRHLERRREFIARALAIDPENAIALGTRALMDTHYRERDYERAIHELVTLIRKHPNNTDLLYYLGYVFTAVGKPELVHRLARRTVQLAPLSEGALRARVLALSQFGPTADFRSAMEEFSRLGVEDPFLNFNLALLDQDADAIRHEASQGPRWLLIWRQALAAYVEGDLNRAREIVIPLKSGSDYRQHCILSWVAVIDDDLDLAFDEYRKGLEAGEGCAFLQVHGSLPYRKTFPDFFTHPRYMQMLEEFGLDPRSVAQLQIPDLPCSVAQLQIPDLPF
jgi:TolB-like protein